MFSKMQLLKVIELLECLLEVITVNCLLPILRIILLMPPNSLPILKKKIIASSILIFTGNLDSYMWIRPAARKSRDNSKLLNL